MVAHKAVGMERAAEAAEGPGKVEQVKAAVLFAYEAGRAIVASLDYVHRHAWQHDSATSWHGGINEPTVYRVDTADRGLSRVRPCLG